MERIFAFGSNKAKQTAHALYSYRTLLSHSAEKGPYSWGFSFSKAGEELILKRRPFHLEGFNMFEPVEHNPVSYGIGTMQTTASTPPLNAVMPFRYHDWFFAMVGGSERENTIKNWLSGTLPPFLKRNLKGHSEQEYVFHLFLSYLYDAGIINVYQYPIQALSDALARTYDTWQLFLQDAGITNPLSGFVVTNGRMILSMASHDDLMGYKQIDGVQRCSYCRDHTHEEKGFKSHPDLRAVFVMADLSLAPREFGLTPLPKERLLFFNGDNLQLLPR